MDQQHNMDNQPPLPPSSNAKFGEQEFTTEELLIMRKRLEQKIGPKDISYRKGNNGGEVPYLETHRAIAFANDIFGYGGWASQVVNLSVDYCDEKNGKVSAGASAIIRIQLKDGTHHEDVGYGTSDNQRNKATALELAKKSAVSDGIKRALRCFGNALGNSMADKDHLKNAKNNPSKLPNPYQQNPGQNNQQQYSIQQNPPQQQYNQPPPTTTYNQQNNQQQNNQPYAQQYQYNNQQSAPPQQYNQQHNQAPSFSQQYGNNQQSYQPQQNISQQPTSAPPQNQQPTSNFADRFAGSDANYANGSSYAHPPTNNVSSTNPPSSNYSDLNYDDLGNY